MKFLIIVLILCVTSAVDGCSPCECLSNEVMRFQGTSITDGSFSEMENFFKLHIRYLSVRQTTLINIYEDLCSWPELIEVYFEDNTFLNCSVVNYFATCVKVLGQCRQSTVFSTKITVLSTKITTGVTPYTTHSSATSTETKLYYESTVETNLNNEVRNINWIYAIPILITLLTGMIALIIFINKKRSNRRIRESYELDVIDNPNYVHEVSIFLI